MLNTMMELCINDLTQLPLQMMATYGTSPEILAPLFSLLCLALLCLAILYFIHLISNTPRYSCGLQSYFPFFFPPTRPFWEPAPPCNHAYPALGFGIHLHRSRPHPIHQTVHTHQTRFWPPESPSHFHDHAHGGRNAGPIHGHG